MRGILIVVEYKRHAKNSLRVAGQKVELACLGSSREFDAFILTQVFLGTSLAERHI